MTPRFPTRSPIVLRELSPQEESLALALLLDEDEALLEAREREDRAKELDATEWWGKP